MTILARVTNLLQSRGYTVDVREAGVIRIKSGGVLVGMIVVRDERVTYAEFEGVVFPFHRTSNYTAEVHDLNMTLKESAPHGD